MNYNDQLESITNKYNDLREAVKGTYEYYDGQLDALRNRLIDAEDQLMNLAAENALLKQQLKTRKVQ